MKAARVREWSASQRPAAPGLGSAAARGNSGGKAPGIGCPHRQFNMSICSAQRKTAEHSDPRGWLAKQEQQIAAA